jgi:hypothetical protein
MSEHTGQRSGEPIDPGFAPGDYTDGRKPGDWRSRYEGEALAAIRWEAAYLTIVFVLTIGGMFLVWWGYPQRRLGLTDQRGIIFARHCLAGLSGILGGVLFAMKWLYHSVAKQIWNLDRRWWRYFTPVISGGLAFAMILVIKSFGGFDPNLVSTDGRTTAVGFLIGLFSDNALAKLAEVAQTLFGPTHRRNERSGSDR